MRLRPLVALSAVALSALLLAGCSGGGDPSPEASTTGAGADLCASAAPSGAVSDGVTATGDVGSVPTVDFSKPLSADGLTLQRTVTVEGTGAALKAGDFVDYAATILDGTTGDVLSQSGYQPGQLLPQQVSAQSGGSIFGCATIGSRIAIATATGDEKMPTVVYVVDVLGVTPTAAWGEPQQPEAGMPTVTLDDSGAPSITVPADLADPATTEVSVLKKGDGPVVQSGDSVLVQYKGVLKDGTEFDSSWKKGTPVSFTTTGVVAGFQKALEGQTVGSQVLAVIPAAEGYGDKEQGAIPANSTLVFVVDILAVAPNAAQ
ncbi:MULTISPECIES: FKBP-type peptidyl-prolyl cis-trans isomerase [unclassified Microbacterium]|uniref:FKBP-type peptidyl-prolyl cis-trans isomerase n=1 Tax=unclassified Microbacterium TaxID=2609290 RepID=UPI00301A89CC